MAVGGRPWPRIRRRRRGADTGPHGRAEDDGHVVEDLHRPSIQPGRFELPSTQRLHSGISQAGKGLEYADFLDRPLLRDHRLQNDRAADAGLQCPRGVGRLHAPQLARASHCSRHIPRNTLQIGRRDHCSAQLLGRISQHAKGFLRTLPETGGDSHALDRRRRRFAAQRRRLRRSTDPVRKRRFRHPAGHSRDGNRKGRQHIAAVLVDGLDQPLLHESQTLSGLVSRALPRGACVKTREQFRHGAMRLLQAAQGHRLGHRLQMMSRDSDSGPVFPTQLGRRKPERRRPRPEAKGPRPPPPPRRSHQASEIGTRPSRRRREPDPSPRFLCRARGASASSARA